MQTSHLPDIIRADTSLKIYIFLKDLATLITLYLQDFFFKYNYCIQIKRQYNKSYILKLYRQLLFNNIPELIF